MSQQLPYRIAIIDLGANTCRLVVFHAIPGYAFRLEDQIREVTRLRQGMTPAGLTQEAMERALLTLRLFMRFCESAGIHHVVAAATSAVREAANGPAFVERVRQEIGLTLRLLSGPEEAAYGILGALNDVPLTEGYVLDIGGGSAQVSLVQGGRFQVGDALTLGALALTERFVRHDPIDSAEYDAIEQETRRQFDTLPWLNPPAPATRLVGVGGVIRNLAAMECARQASPLSTLHGVTLSRASVAHSLELLRTLPLRERQTIPGLHSDRADIILPGALVLHTLMQRLAVDSVAVSVNGIREGLFFERFWGHLPYPVIPDVRRFGVLNLARTYQYQKHHAAHVRFLAQRLFHQLTPLHGYGPDELALLDAAALLHDLGIVIGYEDHDRHSQTLIEYNGLPGFTPREIALIGLLTRYHRQGKPNATGYKMLLDVGDRRLLRQLAAILRLAEFLERGRNAAVDDVIVTWDNDNLHLTLIADEYPAVEMWETARKAAPLFERAFKRHVHLDSLASPPAR